MPRTKRHRVLEAPVQDVWATVGDPYNLPRWWPRVWRVESVDHTGFTQVMRTQKGRAVRADFKLVRLDAPEAIAWRQVLEGSPFERMLAEAGTEITLAPEGEDATRVVVAHTQKLRGLSRLGGFLVRGATRRLLDEALDGLQGLHGRG